MISESQTSLFCAGDFREIENYDAAVADKTQVWDIHHRKEATFSRKRLIEMDEYYGRPPQELIFLTHAEHASLHKAGRNHPMHGKKHSAEARQKMSSAHLGRPKSEQTRIRMSIARRGKPTVLGYSWWNDGNTQVLAKSPPAGFVKGRLKKRKDTV